MPNQECLTLSNDKLISPQEKLPVSIKSLYKKAAATLHLHNIAAAFLRLGFGVPTTPIRLFDSYTTPICKAPFRENVPKLV